MTGTDEQGKGGDGTGETVLFHWFGILADKKKMKTIRMSICPEVCPCQIHCFSI